MDEKAEDSEYDGILDFGGINNNLEFRNVCFGYGSDQKVLHNLNFNIKAGETVAFVGTSGIGKTTISNLIYRFYNNYSGKILIDETDIKSYKLRSYREKIGILPQDIFMFNGTIKENIAFLDREVSDEEIELAAKKANIHTYIENLPEKYETNIGEKGVKLSGGQKQRISIARMFLRNPSLLILDEATSFLDTENEKIILDSFKELCSGRTTLIIAHRLSTIKHVDKIFVLGKNGIAEVGTHDELMMKKGKYYRMHAISGLDFES